KSEVSQEFAATRASIQAHIGAQQAAASTQGETELSEARVVFAARRQAALDEASALVQGEEWEGNYQADDVTDHAADAIASIKQIAQDRPAVSSASIEARVAALTAVENAVAVAVGEIQNNA